MRTWKAVNIDEVTAEQRTGGELNNNKKSELPRNGQVKGCKL